MSVAVLLLLLAATLTVGVAGVVVLVGEAAGRARLAERSALEVVERRSARPANRFEAALRRTEVGRMVGDRLAGSGLSWRVVDFLALNVAAFGVGFLVAGRFLPPLLAAVAGAGAVRACWAYVNRARRRRREEFVAQLPEIARVVSNGTSAGLSLAAAIDLAASELDEPAGPELAQLSRELELGQTLGRALDNLKRRMPSRDVGVLVATLVIQQRAGGDLVRALKDIAETLETRKDLAREIRTTMAGAVYTSYLVVVMAALIVLLANAASPGAFDKLLASGPGRVAFVVAVGLFGVGQVLVQRIARIRP